MEIGWRLVSPRSQQELEMSVLFECACASQTLVTHRRSITQPSLQKFLAGKHSSEFEVMVLIPCLRKSVSQGC